MLTDGERNVLQAERKALEMRKEQKPEPLPLLVKAFWEHEERDTPPCRVESSEDRQQREEMEKAGVRWRQVSIKAPTCDNRCCVNSSATRCKPRSVNSAGAL